MEEEKSTKKVAILRHLPSGYSVTSKPYTNTSEILDPLKLVFKAPSCDVVFTEQIISQSIMEIYDEEFFKQDKVRKRKGK